MADADREAEVPEGAAVFPEIPDDLNIHPLLLALLHAVVFIAGSDEELVDAAAGEEALEGVGGYLRRLQGADRERVRSDLAKLADFARTEGWEPEEIGLFQNFLADFGAEE
jgi:hypothetical protein